MTFARVAFLSLSLAMSQPAWSAAMLSDISTTAMPDTVAISFTSGQVGFSSTGYSGTGAAGVGEIDTSFGSAVYDYIFYANTNVVGPQALFTDYMTSNAYLARGDIWLTSDPETQAADAVGVGTRSDTGNSGSVDISGLESGSLWVLHGRWQGGTTDNVDLLMSGSGPDVPLTGAGQTIAGTTGTLMWATRIDFSDAADYDTITFTHNISSGSGYMLGGVLSDVTLVPEPSSFLMSALGGMLLLRRRR